MANVSRIQQRAPEAPAPRSQVKKESKSASAGAPPRARMGAAKAPQAGGSKAVPARLTAPPRAQEDPPYRELAPGSLPPGERFDWVTGGLDIILQAGRRVAVGLREDSEQLVFVVDGIRWDVTVRESLERAAEILDAARLLDVELECGKSAAARWYRQIASSIPC